MKIDGLSKIPQNDKSRDVIKKYLEATRVTMGDGSTSDRVCLLCVNRMVPSMGSASDCVCNEARELLGGYSK
jgi:hypothetical protein